MGILHAFLKSQNSELEKRSRMNDQTCYDLDCPFLRRAWRLGSGAECRLVCNTGTCPGAGNVALLIHVCAPPSFARSYLHR